MISTWLHCVTSALFLTSSSALMVLSCIISWKRSKLFVPMGCSSSSLHRATSWGRSRCSSVSSSSNSFENWTMSFVVGCSPVPRTWRAKWTWQTDSSVSINELTSAGLGQGVKGQTGGNYNANWHILQLNHEGVVYLLNVCGEALGFVLGLSFGLVPSSHLSDGLLEELGQFQFSCQPLLLFLLLQREEAVFLLRPLSKRALSWKSRNKEWMFFFLPA